MTSSPTSRRRVALVAGASRGLGLLVATELARRGLQVAISSRSQDSLDAAAAALAERGLVVHPYVADVTDREAMTGLVAAVERDLGPIDVAIHVAGVIQVGPLESATPEMFDQAIDIMLKGPINLAMAVLPEMRARGFGRIGTVTSVGGMVSVPHLVPYSTAKFGAVGFSQGLSAELAGTGVTSTTIVPGLMRTGSHLAAQFTGDAPAEYAWFAPGASLPLVSMDAEVAAERMVDGVLAGRPMVVLSPLSQVAMRVAGLAPATTTRALGLMARALPRAKGAAGEVVDGREARDGLSPTARRVVGLLTTWGDRAAARTNEHSLGQGTSPTRPGADRAEGDRA